MIGVVNEEYLQKACRYVKGRVDNGDETELAISWGCVVFSIPLVKLRTAWSKYLNEVDNSRKQRYTD